MSEQVSNKGEHRLHYNIRIRKNGQFDILCDISEKFTLVQLMDSVGNVNHAVSLVGYWIFESNNKKSLPLTLYSLNILCPTSVGEGIFVVFESVFHAFIYINNIGKMKISD